jgi:hypothetical protein
MMRREWNHEKHERHEKGKSQDLTTPVNGPSSLLGTLLGSPIGSSIGRSFSCLSCFSWFLLFSYWNMRFRDLNE